MAGKSIFNSYTLPNGKMIRTMDNKVRDAALGAARDAAARLMSRPLPAAQQSKPTNDRAKPRPK